MVLTPLPYFAHLVSKPKSFDLFQRSTPTAFAVTDRGRTHGSHSTSFSNQRGRSHSHKSNVTTRKRKKKKKKKKSKLSLSPPSPHISPTPPTTAKWSGKKKKKRNRNKDFEKGKIRERNRGKITDVGREVLEMASLQADLIGMERDRKVIGKLDLLYFYLTEIEKLC